MTKYKRLYLSIIATSCFFFQSIAQVETVKEAFTDPRTEVAKGTDSNYIVSYGQTLVARIYGQKGINHLNIDAPSNVSDLKYAANLRHTIGIGLSYRFLSVNLGLVGIGGSESEKGKTKSLDFQFNLYYRKWAIDAMVKSYKGMYLTDKGSVPGVSDYYINPNLRSSIYGFSGWRILNPTQFSYKAVMTQNEWQKKSAGSFLVGWEMYYGSVNAHDSIVPVAITDPFKQKGIQSLTYFKTGPGAGYAYNFVFKKNWFLSGGLTYNVDLSFMKESSAASSANVFRIQPNLNYRLGAGYNSPNWNINFQFLNSNYPIKGALSDGKYKQYAGNYRLSFNKRLYFSKKMKKIIKPLDNRMDDVDKAVNKTLNNVVK